MLYPEFINKAANLTITEADNGLFYLEPLWDSILNDNQLYVTKTGTFARNLVLEALELEVKKRNTINSKTPAVINWVHDIISTQVEPAILAEETDYIKQVTEFMKANHLNGES